MSHQINYMQTHTHTIILVSILMHLYGFSKLYPRGAYGFDTMEWHDKY